ncbi:unnamed protein product [Moneuplotes crassus]|uniref:USP domain-containing protein n=1 Tax=Euplotes crassus TaxID=5936 RepID=A0AAD2DA95_EUPCR|nr:unnamed protein product [Moneuplotes crassus]
MNLYMRVESMREPLEKLAQTITSEMKSLNVTTKEILLLMRDAFQDAQMYQEKDDNPDNKFFSIQKLCSLRETMSINYPNSFRLKEPSDAQLFLALLHQLFQETDLNELVQSTYKMSYLSPDEDNIGGLKERHTFFLTIPADEIAVASTLIKTNPKLSLKHKLIKIAKHTLGSQPGCELEAIKNICKDEETFIEQEPLNLIREPPKIITFYLQYGEFFNAVDCDFPSRRAMINLPPPSFHLFELFIPSYDSSNLSLSSNTFSTIQESDEYEFFGFVGYYGFHYMAFVQENGIWHSCEDENHKVLGGYEKMVNHCRKNKVIPYLIFYQVKPRRLTESTKVTEEVKLNGEESGNTITTITEETKERSSGSEPRLRKLESIPRHLEGLDDIGEVEEDLETTETGTQDNRFSLQQEVKRIDKKLPDMLKSENKVTFKTILAKCQFLNQDINSIKQSDDISCSKNSKNSELPVSSLHFSKPLSSEALEETKQPALHSHNSCSQPPILPLLTSPTPQKDPHYNANSLSSKSQKSQKSSESSKTPPTKKRISDRQTKLQDGKEPMKKCNCTVF